jgi:hypothetical protein
MRGTASLTVERAHARVAIAAFICMFGAGLARAQDMEPRSYSASPIDTNFLIGSYQRTTGDVALDADLPISDVKAAIIRASLLTIAPSICSGIRAVSLSCYPISRGISVETSAVRVSRSPGRVSATSPFA